MDSPPMIREHDHPAKFSAPILEHLSELAQRLDGPIVDPFAGVGRIHGIGRDDTHGIELEPEFAISHPRTRVGDALNPAHYPNPIGSIVTSPCYGNRFAGNYRGPKCERCHGYGSDSPGNGRPLLCPKCKGSGRDSTGRSGYAISLGRDLSDGSAAAWTFGASYRAFHRRWLALVAGILPAGDARLVVNMKDHYKTAKGVQRRVYVSHWWLSAAYDHGFRLAEATEIPVSGYGFGQNSDARTETESVFVFDLKARD